MKTTLNELVSATTHIKIPSFNKLLSSLGKTTPDDEPLDMEYVLDEIGITETIWILSVIKPRSDFVIEFAIKCAWHVLPIFESEFPNDNRPAAFLELAMSKKQNSFSIKNLEMANNITNSYAAYVDNLSAGVCAAYSAFAAYAAAAAHFRNDGISKPFFFNCCVAYSYSVSAKGCGFERNWQLEMLRRMMEQEE